MHGKQKQHSPQSSQAGFTIIESLLAIIIVTVLMVAIGPVVFISVAARVQARRVERATEAAKTYIDGVSSGSIKPTALTEPNPNLLKNYRVPTASNFPRQVDWSRPSGFYCVDLDNKNPPGSCSTSSSKDLVIQAFRTAGPPSEGYRLGVRVYRADAFRPPGRLQTKQQAALKGTLGDRQAPLVSLITDIAPTGSYKNSLPSWCDRLRNRSNRNSGC
jgi:prepilin-type N-terminal cleavage/methylation domain-containing protein